MLISHRSVPENLGTPLSPFFPIIAKPDNPITLHHHDQQHRQQSPLVSSSYCSLISRCHLALLYLYRSSPAMSHWPLAQPHELCTLAVVAVQRGAHSLDSSLTTASQLSRPWVFRVQIPSCRAALATPATNTRQSRPNSSLMHAFLRRPDQVS